MNHVESQFVRPPAHYRGKPFWAWNGDLDKEELLRQVAVLKEMGFGGFFMHSRVGLVNTYLGDEWFDLVNRVADAGLAAGLEPWLYDEDRWPSGSAGGLATQDLRYRQRYLRMRCIPAAEFSWPAESLGAFVGKLRETHWTQFRRLRPDEAIREKELGATVLIFTMELMKPGSFYNGATYLDTMNPDATDEFIRLTHEQYIRHGGGRLGTTIRGIFTDEPHRGMIMSGFGTQDDPTWVVPWTDRLPEIFTQRFGYDLLEHLPEIYLRRDGKRLSRIKWNYVELLQQMLIEGFLKPVNNWCRAHNLTLTGHVLHEDNLVSNVVPNGSMMRNYEHMDAPGIDVLTEDRRVYWAAKQLSSVARQVGHCRQLLSELYGCTGWQFSFESHKAVGNWQALFGINLRCHHLSWFTMQGEAKRDYPASIFHQSAWWREYRYVEDYFSRLHVVLEQGKPHCDLLVLHPVESVWAQIHHGWVDHLEARCPYLQELERIFAQNFHWLAGHQIDFDYGDEDLLRRLGSVEDTAEGPKLRVGQAAYRAVLVSGLETIRASTLELLEAFLARGGRVVFAGVPPSHLDAVADARPAALAALSIKCPLSPASLIAACDKATDGPVVRVTGADGNVLTDIYCQLRRDGDAAWLVAMNMSTEHWRRGARVRVRAVGIVEEWNCQTGTRHGVASREVAAAEIEILCDFPPSGEHVYRIAPNMESTRQSTDNLVTDQRQIELSGPFSFCLDEPNVAVLDRALFRFGEEEWQEEMEILRVDKTIRQAVGLAERGGEMVQPWFDAGRVPEPKGMIDLEFSFDVETMPAGLVELAVERPELFCITLNSINIAPSPTADWWIDICFKRVSIPIGLLRIGTNSIRLKTAFHDGVGLEAIYLLGNFGVRLAGTRPVLIELPSAIQVGTLVNQGLPFYGGKLTCRMELPAMSVETDERIFLEVPAFEAACLVVHQPEIEPRLIGWQPYEAEVTRAVSAGASIDLEIALTRRNTFGPLHQSSLKADGYGPWNFRTTGKAWSEAPNFYPAGLLAPPILTVRKTCHPLSTIFRTDPETLVEQDD